jgi:hypothetical protein
MLFSKLRTTPRRRIGEWRCSSTYSFTSALDGGKRPASRPDRSTSRKRATVTHWIGGLVGPADVPDAVMKRKTHSPHRESNSRTPIVQPAAQSLYRLCLIIFHDFFDRLNSGNACHHLLQDLSSSLLLSKNIKIKIFYLSFVLIGIPSLGATQIERV